MSINVLEIIAVILINACLFKSIETSNSSSSSCTSNIFCTGKLLNYTQMSRIFNDGKYFVDMKLKYMPDRVEEDFENLLNKTGNNPDKNALKNFIDTNFEPPGAGFNQWIPDDWKEKPSLANQIYDINLKNWFYELNSLWKILGRQIDEDVSKNSYLYSQIYVPHPFIVPGGRFKEFYYWDTYWIVDGLLLSEMLPSAQGIIRNFLYLVERYNYVPNGGRIYYLGRSQPPLLISMFHLYFKVTNDILFLKESITNLEKEFKFWLTNRTLTVTKYGEMYQVFQYNVHSAEPRPESFYVDVEKAKAMDGFLKEEFYSGLKSAAESGWDFSTRWFISNGTRTNRITDIHPQYLAPICLNSIMGYNAHLLSEYFNILQNDIKYKEYRDMAIKINKTISRLFWDDDEGMWFDYNVVSNELQKGFYPSNLMPLWAETVGLERTREYTIRKVMNYLVKVNLTSYPGGIPTSLIKSNQQWDLPNGWAPLQYFMVLGLIKFQDSSKEVEDLAYSLAKNWVLNCYEVFKNTTPHSMFEKYDVTQIGIPGGGGEYELQVGFGWTNGVAIRFLYMYGHKIRTNTSTDFASILLGCVLFSACLLSIVSYCYRLKGSTAQNKNNFMLGDEIDEDDV